MDQKIDYKGYKNNLNEWFVDLDNAVVNALRLYEKEGLPDLNLGNFNRSIVLGSGNAIETGKILFNDREAVFATESDYEHKLEQINIDGAVLISASGKKDAVPIARKLKEKNINRRFLTCNSDAPASEFFDDRDVFVFKSLPEPYTYNTSTYMGMILAKTRESPARILEHIIEKVEPIVPDNLGGKVFTFLVDKKYGLIAPMLQTKFIELFGRKFGRDVFTRQYAEVHATDVVLTTNELFVSFGYKNNILGKGEGDRLEIPLPENCDYGGIMAVGYYFCGKIQKQKPAFFKNSVVDWAERKGREPLVKY